VTTLILAAVIALAVWVARHRSRTLSHLWGQARWWERCVLVLALAPVPGPLDELVGLLVARRVAARLRAPRGAGRL
jgi:hypothetical protein